MLHGMKAPIFWADVASTGKWQYIGSMIISFNTFFVIFRLFVLVRYLDFTHAESASQNLVIILIKIENDFINMKYLF